MTLAVGVTDIMNTQPSPCYIYVHRYMQSDTENFSLQYQRQCHMMVNEIKSNNFLTRLCGGVGGGAEVCLPTPKLIDNIDAGQ